MEFVRVKRFEHEKFVEKKSKFKDEALVYKIIFQKNLSFSLLTKRKNLILIKINNKKIIIKLFS